MRCYSKLWFIPNIFRWLKKARKEGIDSLATKPKLGQRRKLTIKEEQEVKRLIVDKGPRQYDFDFDGVIVESIDIKAKAFARLFENQGEDIVGRIVDCHLKNTGVLRYDKFKYI